MMVKGFLKRHLLGHLISQEYVCLPFEKLTRPFRSFIVLADGSTFDVSDSNLLLGYRPLILGFSSHQDGPYKSESKIQFGISLDYPRMDSTWQGVPSSSQFVGRIILAACDEHQFGDQILYLYRGEHGEHSLLPRYQQWLNALWDGYRHKPDQNIDLDPNNYEQVRIAYSIPREIHIATIGEKGVINMFPTDLHGAADSENYVGSLRKAGKANRQVERFRKLTLSKVDSAMHKWAYEMGKNHIRDLRPEDDFAFIGRSQTWNHPLPESTLSYLELQQIYHLDIDLHRIHFYEVVGKTVLDDTATSLAHIHRYYYAWRKSNHLPGDFLIR